MTKLKFLRDLMKIMRTINFKSFKAEISIIEALVPHKSFKGHISRVVKTSSFLVQKI